MKTLILAAMVLVTSAVGAGAGPLTAAGGSHFLAAPMDTLDRLQSTRTQRARLKAGMEALVAPTLPGMHKWQRQKSARVAIFSSMLVPGLGQTYNGRRIKTSIMVGFITFYATRAIDENRSKVARRKVRDTFKVGTLSWKEQDLFVRFHRENALDFVWFSAATWLIGVLDAFVDAHLFDVRSVDPTIIHGSGSNYVGFDMKF